jgi:hypothetical protein
VSPTTTNECGHARHNGVAGNPADRDSRAPTQPRQELNWLPESYYRLRNRRLAARIASVQSDRIQGAVFAFSKLKWVNGVPSVDSSEILANEEWNFRGDAKSCPEHDLMELIR